MNKISKFHAQVCCKRLKHLNVLLVLNSENNLEWDQIQNHGRYIWTIESKCFKKSCYFSKALNLEFFLKKRKKDSECKLENGPQIRFEQYPKADANAKAKTQNETLSCPICRYKGLCHKMKHCHVLFVDRRE